MNYGHTAQAPLGHTCRQLAITGILRKWTLTVRAGPANLHADPVTLVEDIREVTCD